MQQLARASILCLAALALACSGSTAGQSIDAGTSPSFAIVAALPPSRAAAPFDTTVTVKGGPRSDVRWSVSGTLPPGVTFNVLPTGDLRIFGTPSQSGSFTLTLDAATADGQHATAAYTIVVEPIGQLLGEAGAGADGEAYLATLDVLGAAHGQIRWSVAAGTLPPGITLTAAGVQATLSGTSVEGSYGFTLAAADDLGILAQRSLVVVIGPHLSIDPTPLPDGTVSFPYGANGFQAAGGSGAGYQWTAGPGLPPGILLSRDGSAVSFLGAPTASGIYTFTVTVTDSGGAIAQRTATILVHPNLQLLNAMPPTATIATAYTGTLTATGAVTDLDYRWSVAPGLPPGLALTNAGGIATVSGTPLESGLYDFVVSVSLPTGETASQLLEIRVAENPPQIVTATVPDGTWASDYLATVSAQSAVGGPFQWSLAAGALPPGITLSGTDTEQLTLSGKARFTGTFTFTLAFSDARQSAQASYSMTIGHLDQIEVLAAILDKGRVGHAYAGQIASRGATGPVSFAVERGSLPPGLALASDGSIAGSPAAAGNFSFSVAASDAAGNTAHQRFVVPVAPDLTVVAAAVSTTLGGVQSLVARDVTTATPGPIMPLVASLPQPGNDFSFSLDPNRFSFMTTDLRTASLYVVDLNKPSPVVQIANGAVRADHSGALRWAPDGARFAYATELRAGSFEFAHFIALTDDPATPTGVVAGGLPCRYEGFWSPDATLYATAAVDGSAFYVSDGSTTRTLPIDAGKRFAQVIGWSPDSSLLLVTAADAATLNFQIFALDLSVDQPALFPMTPPDVSINSNLIDFSPDGGGLAALSTSNDAFVIDLRSPQVGPMVRVSGVARVPGWSPDSRRLALFAPGDFSTLSVVDRERIGPPAVVASGLGFVQEAIWSPDSQTILASTASGVLAIPATGGPADTLVTGPVDQRFGVLRGQPPLFVYSDAAGVSSLDLSSPQPRTAVTLDPLPTASGVALAPARRSAFYFRFAANTNPGKLWMIDLGGPLPSAPIELLDFGAGTITYAVSDDSTVVGD